MTIEGRSPQPRCERGPYETDRSSPQHENGPEAQTATGEYFQHAARSRLPVHVGQRADLFDIANDMLRMSAPAVCILHSNDEPEGRMVSPVLARPTDYMMKQVD